MQNKGVVIVLTLIITALCIFYLSFTYVAFKIDQQANAYYTSANGSIDLNKKNLYLSYLWERPVYNVLGKQFKYKEVKQNELSLGLDLQGGMHVVMEISPADILRGLSNNNQNPAFIDALRIASKAPNSNPETFGGLFRKAFKDANPDKSLASLFSSSANQEKIKASDSDDAVLKFLNSEIKGAIDRSYTILKTRLSQFGTVEPSVQQLPGQGRIQIEIPGADNPQRVHKLLEGVARLEFWEVVEINDPVVTRALGAINQFLLKEQAAKKTLAKSQTKKTNLPAGLVKTDAKDTTTKSTLEKELSKAKDTTNTALDSLSNASVSPLFALSNPTMPFLLYKTKDTATINAIFKRPEVLALWPRTVGRFWDVKPDPKQTPNVEDLQLNFVNLGRSGKPLLTGEVIRDANMEYDQYARPAVAMKMNPKGSNAWAKITLAQSNKRPNQGRVAIVLDNYVYTAPTVNGEIPNGNSQISGSFTIEEAKDLSQILKAGSLPAPTKIVEEAIVGPTLGAVARAQGLLSMACGLIIVALFVVVYYTKGGWVANAALLFNIFFIMGTLAQLGFSLTLPGIAGIVLTMGMAIDANVLIFERIKEELRHGRKLRDAIKAGYSKAFATILDSNLTTFLTAVSLFIFGQGPLRGFAVVLMIGIVTSFFSSVFISHVIIDWIVRKGDESRMSFDSVLSSRVSHRRNYDFVGMRKINYVISVSAIVIGFAIIAIQGLNLGVDFKGGRSYIVNFSKPVSSTDIKVALEGSFDHKGTEVKNYGSNAIVKVTTPYLIDDPSEEAGQKVQQAMVSGIEKFSGLTYAPTTSKPDATHFTITGSTKVGPTVASDIKDSAFKAAFVSVLFIFLYILFRFRKWQYSAGAIVATLHDSLFVFSAFAVAHLFGLSFEIDQVFVAAILTVIGYSLNDTVIIFDRIREYLSVGTSHDRPKVFNDAINSTLSRTLITSGTTLTVVLVLMIFGGEVLRGFSFALLIGILIGTYSSIFIAAPIVLDFDKKNFEPKKA